MSDLIAKYAGLVDLLLAKTRESKIPWEYESSRDTVKVWNHDVLLSISQFQDENFENGYNVTLHNNSGVALEAFTDATLSGVAYNIGDDNYFVRLENLFSLAMRQATGADKALDDFIDAIENDKLDLPF